MLGGRYYFPWPQLRLGAEGWGMCGSFARIFSYTPRDFGDNSPASCCTKPDYHQKQAVGSMACIPHAVEVELRNARIFVNNTSFEPRANRVTNRLVCGDSESRQVLTCVFVVESQHTTVALETTLQPGIKVATILIRPVKFQLQGQPYPKAKLLMVCRPKLTQAVQEKWAPSFSSFNDICPEEDPRTRHRPSFAI